MYQINYIAPELQKDTSLSLSARCVLGRIGGLTKRGQKPCYASNEFLANECGLSKRTIQKSLSELEQRKIISTKITLFQGRKTRYIFLIYEPENNSVNSAKYDTTDAQNTLSESAKYDTTGAQSALSNSANSALSTFYIEKDYRDNIESDSTHTTSLDFSFSSIFSAMNKIKSEFNDYIFTEAEIRENTQSYLDKSQGYKFYKGKPTEDKLRSWMRQYVSQKKEKNSAVSGSVDWEKRLAFMNQINEMMRDGSDNEKKSDPIDADFEIIDEHKNKNAPA